MQEPKKNTKAYGEAQERWIVDTLRRAAHTEYQLAEKMKIRRNTVTVYISRMRKQGRVCIVDYIKSTSGRPLPVFGPGNKDKVYVPVKVRKPVQADRVEKMHAAILVLLTAKRHTTAQLAEKLIRSQSVVRGYVRDLKEQGQLHIAGWEQTGSRNGWAPCYRAGKKKDKARPPALSPSEQHARSRAKPGYKERELELRRHRERIKTRKGKPASPFAALGL